MNRLFSESIEKLKDLIMKSESICIISHILPDGDSIGSVLAFGMALRSIKGNQVIMAVNDDIPDIYKFLPGIGQMETINNEDKFDLLITLDCSDLDRLGDKKILVENVKEIVNIDHHISNVNFGDLNIVDSKAAATGEIIYKILEEMNIDITKEIATCIYVAISTDTGSFKYENTSPATHSIASKLLEKGIDLNRITTEIYQSRPLAKTRLLIKSLNTLELYCNGKIGVVSITKEMLNKTGTNINDADGIVEFVRDIHTIEVACILKEIETNEIKVGLRSKKYVDVAEIAKYFNGGGHIRASGCTIKNDLESTKNIILTKIKEYIR
jgi:phosphoesterase RecJ-like protein